MSEASTIEYSLEAVEVMEEREVESPPVHGPSDREETATDSPLHAPSPDLMPIGKRRRSRPYDGEAHGEGVGLHEEAQEEKMVLVGLLQEAHEEAQEEEMVLVGLLGGSLISTVSHISFRLM